MDSLPDSPGQTSFLFDLDGTLIDSVYQHVLAWREALQSVGVSLAVWKHPPPDRDERRAVRQRAGARAGDAAGRRRRLAALPGLHADAFIRRYDSVQALARGAGAADDADPSTSVPWAIATSGPERYAGLARELLALPDDTPMITRDQVRYAKPDPDLFLTAARQIGVDIRQSNVVGDSVWDLLAAQRARALGIGLLSGGYGREELVLLRRLPGVRRPRRPARAPR